MSVIKNSLRVLHVTARILESKVSQNYDWFRKRAATAIPVSGDYSVTRHCKIGSIHARNLCAVAMGSCHDH